MLNLIKIKIILKYYLKFVLTVLFIYSSYLIICLNNINQLNLVNYKVNNYMEYGIVRFGSIMKIFSI